MIPHNELSELLENRLVGHLDEEGIQSLISQIEGLETGWEELNVSHLDMGYSKSVNCPDICFLAEQIDKGAQIKLYRKKDGS